ncbi:MAG: hypothetical protein QM817_40845 [Archangium sp.]
MDNQNEVRGKEEQGRSTVSIEVNASEVRIHRGNTSVAEIKQAGGCPVAFELEQIVDGKLVPMNDDGRVVIKGGERFLCHPRDGASS